MIARPILFSAPMIRALLDGRKTQTRRIVKWKPRTEGYNLGFTGVEAGYYCGSDVASGWVLRSREGIGGCWNDRTWPVHCPYGKPGDLLWVRETWAHYQTVNHIRRPSGGASDEYSDGSAAYRADGFESIEDLRGHIRLMSGHDLQAVEIRDNAWKPSIFMPRWASRLTLRIAGVRVERLHNISEADAIAEGSREPSLVPIIGACWSERDAYAKLWESINGADAWDENPWVWALTFTVEKRNVDDVLRDAKAAA